MRESMNKKLAKIVDKFMMELPDTMTDVQLSTTICAIIDAYVRDSDRRREILMFVADAMDDADKDDEDGDIEKLAGMARAINDADVFLAKSAAGWKK
tara:strand:- start:235 stop:525 length:291 start_codon:yes stop_codon:yes gene_type:complete